jgi:hypothetical protein
MESAALRGYSPHFYTDPVADCGRILRKFKICHRRKGT